MVMIEVDDEIYKFIMEIKLMNAKYIKAEQLYNEYRNQLIKTRADIKRVRQIDDEFAKLTEMKSTMPNIPSSMDKNISHFIYKYQIM